MERSFAYATRYGFKRARWRGLDKMQIQEYLTAVIQNIKILLKYNHKPLKEMGLKVPLKTGKIKRGIGYILKRIDFKMRLTLASQPTLILSNFDFRPHCLV